MERKVYLNESGLTAWGRPYLYSNEVTFFMYHKDDILERIDKCIKMYKDSSDYYEHTEVKFWLTDYNVEKEINHV